MARTSHPLAVTRPRGRGGWLGAAVVLTVLLVGGRWAAIETAERAWAATIPGGETYLDARALAALFRAAILLFAVAWATANLYLVYRSIGAVQLPRRLGDLEIVETISRRVLLGGTIVSGLVFGIVLTWGTGDWWLAAVLASRPPHFGVADPLLRNDLGAYVASLPWSVTLQNHVLAAVASVAAIVTLLYVGIGMITWRAGPVVTPRARLHLALLLTCLAGALAWGALLDPREVVGGVHRLEDAAAIGARAGGAGTLAVIATLAALASVVWGWTGRGLILAVSWATLLAGAPFVYYILPAAVGTPPAGADATAPRAGGSAQLVARAFALRRLGSELPAFADAEQALAAAALWDEARVAAAVQRTAALGPRATVGGVSLSAVTPPRWIVGPAPDDVALRDASPPADWTAAHAGPWSAVSGTLALTESDTGLVATRAPLRDTVVLYGPGFAQYAVRDAVTGTRGGIPLVGWWRRAALAWTLQSTELAQRSVHGHALLWRRDAADRLARLAPFATFEAPRPVVADSTLWWLAWGYVHARNFPQVRPVVWRDRDVRYLHPSFVGIVAAANGATRLFLAPGYDSLAAAWARAFAPLVAPADSLPPALREQLSPPADAFAAALDAAAAEQRDTGWVRRPGAPVEVVAPDPESPRALAVWRVQVFETGSPPQVAALFAGVVTSGGPSYAWWRPSAPLRAPPPVVGVGETRPGLLRLWPAGTAVLSAQALFREPARGARVPPAIDRVFVSVGAEIGEGPTRGDAWADRLAAARPAAEVTETGDRLARARTLLERADAALRAGDVERFGRLYDELKRLLGVPPHALAPLHPPR